jgi:hypothetical protein
VLSQHSNGGTEKEIENLPGNPVSGPRFEPQTFQIWNRTANRSIATFRGRTRSSRVIYKQKLVLFKNLFASMLPNTVQFYYELSYAAIHFTNTKYKLFILLLLPFTDFSFI